MIVRPVESLRRTAENRPAGYLEDCLSTGTLSPDGLTVAFTQEQYAGLVEKYRSYRPQSAGHTPPTELPPLAQRVRNFLSSAANHVAHGMQTCSQEQIDARHAICVLCEFYKDGACAKCGCPLVREKQFISKLSWAHEQCPVGKWGPIVDGHEVPAIPPVRPQP